MSSMKHKLLIRLHALAHSWRFVFSEEMIALLLVLVVFMVPDVSATRLQQRGLFMRSNEPGVTTDYTVSFRYITPAAVSSVDLLFCDNPIPYEPCVTPVGLNAANATLSSQSGETGFSIYSRSTNHIILTRPASMITSGDMSSYTFSNIVNPTPKNHAFSIRLRTHTTPDASGTQIDFGSVRGQVATAITLETQVPPMLIFCLAQTVEESCTDTNDVYYSDMGDLNANSTLIAQSQMAVGTNASGGFAITAYGTPPSAGTSVIPSTTTPSESRPGTNQFGINLVANNAPQVGNDPEGTWLNAVAAPGYEQPNRYKYKSGDVVAYSPNVSLMKKFTVSYILNSSSDLRAGVYTTTITYIASGRF